MLRPDHTSTGNLTRGVRSVVLRMFAALLVTAAFQGGVAGAAVETVDRIIAVINDDVITELEFDSELKAIIRDLRTSGTPIPKSNVLRRQALERMIVERLQLQYADRVGIRIDENMVDAAVESVAQQNKLSVAQLEQVMQRDGIERDLFRETLRKQLVIRRLVEREINAKVAVSPAEIDAFLATQGAGTLEIEYDISHLLVTVSESASAATLGAARQRVDEAHRKASQGVAFGQVVAEYSEAQDALEGGRMGWRKAGQLPTLFLQAIQGLEPGEFSGVVRSPNGFHIVRLNSRRGGAENVVIQSRVRHILIQPTELLNEEEVRQRLLRVRQRIADGEDFADLARLYSEDRATRVNGGDLGWISPGAMFPDFERAMDKLEPGMVSEPIRTQFGLHLIEIVERREKDIKAERDRNIALQQIRARKTDENYEQWVRQLRDESYVEYRMDQL